MVRLDNRPCLYGEVRLSDRLHHRRPDGSFDPAGTAVH